MAKRRRVELSLLDERGDERRHRPAGEGRGLDAQRDQVEHDARQRALQVLGLVGDEAIAARARCAGEHEREPGGAVFEVVQRLGIGGRRIGMIDALQHLPGLRGPARRPRPRGPRADRAARSRRPS